MRRVLEKNRSPDTDIPEAGYNRPHLSLKGSERELFLVPHPSIEARLINFPQRLPYYTRPEFGGRRRYMLRAPDYRNVLVTFASFGFHCPKRLLNDKNKK